MLLKAIQAITGTLIKRERKKATWHKIETNWNREQMKQFQAGSKIGTDLLM